MITDCAIYRAGERVKDGLTLVDLASEPGGGGFVWIDVNYEGEQDAKALADAIELPQPALTEMQARHTRARIYDLGGDYFIVVRTAEYDDEREAIDFGEIQIMVGEDYAVTVRHEDAGDVSAIRILLDDKRDLVEHGPAAVVWAVVEHVVTEYEPIVEALDLDIDDVDTKVFEREGTDITRRMHALRSTVSEFYRAVHPLQGPVEVIESGIYENLHGCRPFFRDLRDRLHLFEEELLAQRDQLSSAFDANMALISKEQTDIVRTISSWAAIIAVPTLMSSAYGMNFRHMPELHWQYGYPLALSAMVLIGYMLYRYFKRVQWL